MATVATLMSAAEFAALPEAADVRRELILGEVKESPMPTYCPEHAELMAELTGRIREWRARQSKPWGFLATGDARCLLREDLVVGIDLAYFPPTVTRTAKHYLGPPVLAVEIASPSDRLSDLSQKCGHYLEAGTAQVWLVNPFGQNIMVFRPGTKAVLFSVGEVLSGDPELPGFSLPLADIMPPPVAREAE